MKEPVADNVFMLSVYPNFLHYSVQHSLADADGIYGMILDVQLKAREVPRVDEQGVSYPCPIVLERLHRLERTLEGRGHVLDEKDVLARQDVRVAVDESAGAM